MKLKSNFFLIITFLAFSITLLFFFNRSICTSSQVQPIESDENICTKYLTSIGWKISDHPIEVCQVTIPQEFNNTYTHYNELQQKQGFNLKKYRGKNCLRLTYNVLNYKDTPYSVHANILLFKGKIIGADICSIELDGFMHEANFTENQL